MAVAELILRLLEVEAERYDLRADDSEMGSRRGANPGVESPSSCAQKYMKLEKLYISQNQDYDPFSHTQHPHELLITQHFEVTQQARRERERQQDEALETCSFRQLEIFERTSAATAFERVNPASCERKLNEQEREAARIAVEERYRGFISKLCGPSTMDQRPSDINFEYVSHLYVIYPNVRQRTELICRCLEVLCDIVTHPGLDPYLRER